jgi:hypothetical protein
VHTVAFWWSYPGQPGWPELGPASSFPNMNTRGQGSDAANVSIGLALAEGAPSRSAEGPLSRARVKGTRLHELLVGRHEEILIRACAKAAARCRLLQTKRNFDAGIALFAAQLVDALGSSTTFRPELLRQAAARQGRSSLRMGFAISQLVYSYGDVCQAVLELASELDAPVAAEEFLVLGFCLDEARASAVAAYEKKRAEEVLRLEARELTQLGDALRNPLDTAFLALGGLKGGTGDLQGQAGALLDRSLSHLQELVGRSLFRVREQAILV